MMIRSVAAAALAAGLLTAGAAEAVTMTAVIEGTIYSGYDYTGEFGTADTDLTDEKVTVTYTFDPDLAPDRSTDGTSIDEASGGAAYGTGQWPSLLAEVTIGGVTKMLTGTYLGFFGSYDDSDGGYDEWYGAVQDYDFDTAASGVVYAYVYDYTEFLPFGLEEPFDFASLPSQVTAFGYFAFTAPDGLGGYDENAYGSFTIDSIRVTSGMAPVPLPATGLLLAAGLAGLAAARRRRG
jgi:hypothetical protein